VRWVICRGWADPATLGENGYQSGSRQPEAGGVDLPLAMATVNGGLPNIMGADGAWKLWG